MKTVQRNSILTLSALALAAALSWLAFESEGRPTILADLVQDRQGTKESTPATTACATSAPRQALDVRTSEAQASGLFSAAPGTTMTFDLDNSGSSVISNQDGALLQSLAVDLRGELHIDVLARREGEMALAVHFTHCKMEQRVAGEVQGADASGAIAISLERPVIVRAKADGTTLGLRFDAQAGAEERNRMRALWGALMPVAPLPLAETWVAEQQDALGAMRCNYRLVSANDSRALIERTSRECTGIEAGRPKPALSGTAQVSVDRALGWFDSALAEETATIEVDAAGWTILSQQVARCTLIQARLDGLVGVDWDLPWDEVSGAADSARMAELSRDQQMRESLDGRTLDQLVNQLTALLAAGDIAAPELVRLREDIGFLLSIDPDALARVAELVLDPRLSSDLVATLVDCVGRAGTPQAQALLAQWIADQDRANNFRQESVYALIELKSPGEEVVGSLANLLGDGNDPELQGSAILTMGVLANIAGSNTAVGATAFHHVMNWKKSAEDNDQLPEWIEALGNSGSPQVVDAVKPYLGNDSDQVRASAVHALRLVFTLEVSDIAALRGEEDNSAIVRGRAAEVLGARVDDHARAAIGNMLDHESVVLVRQALILYLGGQVAHDGGARLLLEDAAATDPSPELRNLAQEQLSGAHHG